MQDIDRSFLSQPEVVQASRKWTCIRVATYENAAEAEYLQGIFSGRSGELENTVFAFMDPTARKHLAAPSRGPRGLFSDPSDMSSAMDRMAQSYRASAPVSDELPKVESLRLALNIAACEASRSSSSLREQPRSNWPKPPGHLRTSARRSISEPSFKRELKLISSCRTSSG